jgi:hypothetical protein
MMFVNTKTADFRGGLPPLNIIKSLDVSKNIYRKVTSIFITYLY